MLATGQSPQIFAVNGLEGREIASLEILQLVRWSRETYLRALCMSHLIVSHLVAAFISQYRINTP
jgi:hypothetical protein